MKKVTIELVIPKNKLKKTTENRTNRILFITPVTLNLANRTLHTIITGRNKIIKKPVTLLANTSSSATSSNCTPHLNINAIITEILNKLLFR